MSEQQHPLNSGFGFNSTAMEVIDGLNLRGKMAIVTGGHGGIGLETTRALASAGATVVVGARDLSKARQALYGTNNIELIRLDLNDPGAIDQFVATFLASYRSLDILINNAGVSGPPQVKDARGFDIHFATNYLGHFQLTVGLWEALKRPGRARVVGLSSVGHMTGGVDFHDLQFNKRPYDKTISYGQSKSAVALFALHLDKLGRKYGIRAFSVHPGGVMTELARYKTDEELAAWGIIRGPDGKLTIPPGFKSAEQGAATTVWCATSAQLDGVGGVYCEDCDVARSVPADYRELKGVRPWAMDPVAAESLWAVSEDLLRLYGKVA